jgi:hypothetical protein
MDDTMMASITVTASTSFLHIMNLTKFELIQPNIRVEFFVAVKIHIMRGTVLSPSSGWK